MSISKYMFAIIISGNGAWVLALLGHESSGDIICHFLFLVSPVHGFILSMSY